MIKPIQIIRALEKERSRLLRVDGKIIEQARNVIKDNLFTEKNVLVNLQLYNQRFEFLAEENLEREKIFGLEEIKTICIHYNLRFLDVIKFKGKIPSEASEQLQFLSVKRKKPIEKLKVLGPDELFRNSHYHSDPIIFAETDKGNFYLIHQWGNKVAWHVPFTTFPFRNIENLAATLAGFCVLLTIITPQGWIMDTTKIPYWGMHRFALFFHLFILFGAMTLFIMLSFRFGFTSSKWDDERL
jgi:hypothetical protein